MAHKKSKHLSLKTEISPADERLGRLLVTFEIPNNPSPDQVDLAREIVRVDHRSLHTLPPGSNERAEVRDLLLNVVSFLQAGQTEAGRSLLQHAEAVYMQHIQAWNRLRYLLGMLVGILAMLVFGFVFVQVSGVLETVIPTQVMLLVFLFAGMGAMTSVLTRLSSIDLRDQTSIQLVVISGIARPVTAVFLALVISLVLALRIVDLHVGVASGEGVPPSLLWVAAFLCGFSERFAQDVLARVGGDIEEKRDTDSAIDLPRGAESAPPAKPTRRS